MTTELSLQRFLIGFPPPKKTIYRFCNGVKVLDRQIADHQTKKNDGQMHGRHLGKGG